MRRRFKDSDRGGHQGNKECGGGSRIVTVEGDKGCRECGGGSRIYRDGGGDQGKSEYGGDQRSIGMVEGIRGKWGKRLGTLSSLV